MNPLGSLFDIIPGTVPADLQTAVPGQYISLKNADGVLVVFFKGAGTAGEDPVLELQQAKTVAGGSAKDLNGFVEIHKRQAASLGSVTTWTKVSQTADEDFVGDGTSAEQQGLYAAWISATSLDVNNGFVYVAVNVKDTGVAAQIGGVFYIVCGLRYGGSPTRTPALNT